MSRLKKIVSFIALICFIWVSTASSMVKAEETANVSLYAELPHSIIKVGSTVTIKTSATVNNKKVNNFIFSSNNKKVATVNKSGKITAVSAGECEITVYLKGYKDDHRFIGVQVVDRIIKISGPSKYVAGNTYQLKASEKNVVWDMHNLDSSARASIDPDSGKIKIRGAGQIYIMCKSSDGKGLGAVYINTQGPEIDKTTTTLDPIEITEDEHIVSINELKASGKLPEIVSLPYTYGKKKGTVEVAVIWEDYVEYEQGKYTISGRIDASQEKELMYSFSYYRTYVSVDVDFKVTQTDTRKKIVSIEKLDPIIISKDEHITEFWTILEKYFVDKKLKCQLEDGSIVELPAGSIGYSKYMNGVGTYKCELQPEETAGYDNGGYEGPRAELTIKISKKQTGEGFVNSLDTIAQESIVYEAVSQDPLGK